MTWPRDDFASAVWDSDLSTTQKLVALAYADHARAGDIAWVDQSRLMERVSCSRDTVWRATTALHTAGWLGLVEPARQHYSARYRLCIPGQASEDLTTGTQESDGQTAQMSGHQTAEAQASDGAAQASDSAASAVRSSDPTASPHLSPEGERGGCVTPAVAEGVALIVAAGYTEDQAIAAATKIVSGRPEDDPIRNWAGYLAKIGTEGIDRLAGLRPGVTTAGSKAPRPGECGHEIRGGMTVIVDRDLGEIRSCDQCEAIAPARLDPAYAARDTGAA